ncbi:MAG: oligoendopeptidase F [Clostridiales bacterium]|nr:oligoendopeptidase F [Clostridiales bacterium]
MRLWHEALLSELPRAQLLGQHRECCALRGGSWGKPHAVVNYVFAHPMEDLYVYHRRVMAEMERRGYTVERRWYRPDYRGKRRPAYHPDEERLWKMWGRMPVYQEHDDGYLSECLLNLRNKGIAVETDSPLCYNTHSPMENYGKGRRLPMENEARQKIEPQYKWRLTDIYETEEDWEKALQRVVSLNDQMKGYRGRLGESAAVLAEALALDEKLSVELEQMFLYTKLYRDLDHADPYYQSLNDRALSVLYQVQEDGAFVMPELAAIQPDTLLKWVRETPALRDYAHMADDIIRSRAHVLSEREEQLMAMATPALETMDTAFTLLDSVDLKRGEVTDEEGKRVPLTDGLYSRLRDSRKREVRAGAFQAMHEAFAAMGNTIAALYAGSVRADVFRARARGYQSSLDAALFSDNLPRSIYTGLIEAVHEALPSYYRYLELRRKALGLDELHIYDCYLPIVDTPDKEYTYEEACDTVKNYLKPLGDTYREDLDRLLSGGWVDVYETPGKATGAYACGVYGVHPYMLLNFSGKLNDVFTVAHEAGHCLHTYYSDQQPYINKDYPIFLAEIASTVNENILMREMMAGCDLSTEEGRKEKAYLINRYLEEFKGSVFRQTMFAEFELKAHEMAERGEPLTAEALCAVYHDLLTLYFGPDVVIDEYMDWEWARIPHFYNAFYVFKYATGFSAAAAISRRLLDGGDREPYLRFLAAGGSDYPADTLKRAGVDMSTPEPARVALREFDSLVGELADLIG